MARDVGRRQGGAPRPLPRAGRVCRPTTFLRPPYLLPTLGVFSRHARSAEQSGASADTQKPFQGGNGMPEGWEVKFSKSQVLLSRANLRLRELPWHASKDDLGADF